MGRVRRSAVLLMGMAWIAASRCVANAQIRAVTPQSTATPTSAAGALGQLAARAGLIFVGTVEAIDRASGVVEVTLQVEQVLQGQPGARYVLREWAGRWPPGLRRYTIGQRALFFLNSPGASGLSSPVNGGEGVVPVFGDPASGAMLDVRRLNATLLRQMGDKLDTNSTLKLQDAVQAIAAGAQPNSRRPQNPSGERAVPIVIRGAAGARLMGAPDAVR